MCLFISMAKKATQSIIIPKVGKMVSYVFGGYGISKAAVTTLNMSFVCRKLSE